MLMLIFDLQGQQVIPYSVMSCRLNVLCENPDGLHACCIPPLNYTCCSLHCLSMRATLIININVRCVLCIIIAVT